MDGPGGVGGPEQRGRGRASVGRLEWRPRGEAEERLGLRAQVAALWPSGVEESPSSGTTVPGVWSVFGEVPGLGDLCSAVPDPDPETHGPLELRCGNVLV